MKIKYTTISLFLILFLTSCEKWFWQPDKLHLEKKAYTGSELRIDGYYYYEWISDKKEKYIGHLFLYKNGIILEGAYFLSSDSTEIEFNYRNGSWLEQNKNYRWNWGIFNIDNLAIKYESWSPFDLGDPAYIYEGEILNDTTFFISKSYRLKRGKEKDITQLERLYHFKQFSSKPDSTNVFVK